MHDWEEMLFFGRSFEFGWVVMIVFWLLLLVGGIALVRWLVLSAAGRDSRSREQPEKTAEDLLRERYARGEIERDEFTRRLDELKTSRRGG